MISHYRLGDLFYLHMQNDLEAIKQIIINHPYSIGSKFICEKMNYMHDNYGDIDNTTTSRIFMKYVMQHMEAMRFPEDLEESIVIHLRLGDSIGGSKWHEKICRPLAVSVIKEHVNKIKETHPDIKCYVIGKCHFGVESSLDVETGIKKSEEYLNEVLKELGAEHYDGGDADNDFCFAVKAKYFIQGKGFYSRLIKEARECCKNYNNIETASHDWDNMK